MQQPAESFVTDDLTVDMSEFLARFYQAVAQALVIPLRMIVLEELVHGFLHRLLPEEDHAIQALTLQTSHKSLHVCVEVRGSRGELHGVYISLLDNGTERLAELRVAVHDQVPAAKQESVD